MNEENFIKNKNNRRNYDELKYKVIGDGNIDNVNLGGNEQILINNGNLIKNMKNDEQNDNINNEDFEKQKFVKILKRLNNYAKKLYLKMLIMINAIMMILMKKKLMEVTLKKLNNY